MGVRPQATGDGAVRLPTGAGPEKTRAEVSLRSRALAMRVSARKSSRVRSLTVLKAMVTAAIVLQRFAVPLGSEQVSFVLVAEIALLGVLFVRGELLLERKRTLWYLIAVAACLAAAAIASDSGDGSSLPSILLLIAMYAPFCLTLTPSLRRLYRPVLEFFTALMAIVAVVAVLQMLLQLAGWSYSDPLASVPSDVLAQGYNTAYPLEYGSAIVKSNAFVFLEPSFLSQFLALAFIVELTTGARLWRLLLYFGAMLTTVSGTGVILLVFGLVIWLFKRADTRPVLFLVPFVVAVGVTLATPVGTLFSTRISGEGSTQTSSSNARFVQPYERVYDDLNQSVPHSVVGRGPGFAERDADEVFVQQGIPIVYPVVPKLTFEYGLFAGLLFAGFIVFAFLNRTPSIVIASSALLMHFLLSGSLLQAHTLYLCYILTSLFAATEVEKRWDHRGGRRRVMVATS